MAATDLAEVSPAQPQQADPAARVAQGIVCGAWALAFEFGWSRSIVDNFELVAVPQASEWLVGAANIDGDLVPVVDLVRLISPQATPFLRQPGQRLLIGGKGLEAIAIVFTRRPQMIRYVPHDGQQLAFVPASIRGVARGMATNENGESYIEIDGYKLTELLALQSS